MAGITRYECMGNPHLNDWYCRIHNDIGAAHHHHRTYQSDWSAQSFGSQQLFSQKDIPVAVSLYYRKRNVDRRYYRNRPNLFTDAFQNREVESGDLLCRYSSGIIQYYYFRNYQRMLVPCLISNATRSVL